MSQRDPDHLPSLDALSEQFGRAARESSARPRSRSPRRIALIVALGILAISSVAGAARLLGVGTPFDDHRDVPSRLRPAGAGVIAAVAPDSTPGVRWAVRIYTSRDGADCVIAGRLRAGTIGVMRGGQFRPLAAGTPGACTQLRPGPVFFVAFHPPDPLARTLIVGRVASGIRAVHLVAADVDRVLSVGRGGAFLAVFAGRRLTARDVSISAVRRP